MDIITQELTPDLDPFNLTIEEIDNEQARITEQEPATIEAIAAGQVTPEALAQLRDRLQALSDAKLVAVARGHAAKAARDRVVREQFDALAADVTAAFSAQAIAIDAWVREGARLLNDYRAVEQRLAEFAPLLGPLIRGREVEAALLRQTLVLDAHLERQLATVGVLPHMTPTRSSQTPEFTFEQYVGTRLVQFLNEVRQRLPGLPTDEGVVQSPSQEAPHHA